MTMNGLATCIFRHICMSTQCSQFIILPFIIKVLSMISSFPCLLFIFKCWFFFLSNPKYKSLEIFSGILRNSSPTLNTTPIWECWNFGIIPNTSVGFAMNRTYLIMYHFWQCFSVKSLMLMLMHGKQLVETFIQRRNTIYMSFYLQ